MTSTPIVEFGPRPVTQEIYAPDGLITRISSRAVRWSDPAMDRGVLTVQMLDPAGDRAMFLSEIKLDVPGLLEGISIPNGRLVRYRETTEWDVVGAHISSYPWPVPVISALVNTDYHGGGVGNVHLEALADDSGNVMTIMQVSDAGLYLRYSGQWVELQDPDVIENWGAVEVADNALTLYDAFDQSGQTVSLFTMPVKDVLDLAPYRGEAVATVEMTGVAGSIEPEPKPVPVLPMPVINSRRDVPGAVETALQDSSHRWYVERRIKALGLDYNLPWEAEE